MNVYVLDDIPPELGDVDPELVQLAATVLSRYIAESNEKGSVYVSRLARLLESYDSDGASRDRVRMHSVEVALRRLGTDRIAMREAWQRAKAHHRLLARLPYHVLLACFPAPLWIPLMAVITDGPEESAAHVESALLLDSLRDVRPTRARPTGGRVSLATLKAKEIVFRRLTKVLYRLHGKYPSAHLDAWQGTPPPIEIPDAPMAHTDRSAPPLRLVRQRLKRFNKDIAAILDAHDGDEAAAVLRLPEWKLHRGLFTLLRDRTLFVLTVVLGARIGAIADIKRGSIIDPCIRIDRSFGATVHLYPGKSLSAHELRPKPIPDDVYDLIRTYITFVERVLGRPMHDHEALIVPTLNQRGVRKRRSRAKHDSLGSAHERRQPDRHVHAVVAKDEKTRWGQPGSRPATYELCGYARNTVSQRFIGVERWRLRAILPKDESNDYIGHSAHTLRHLAEQLVKRGAPEYCERHGLVATPQAVADALLDHDAVDSDPLGYSDFASHIGRLRLSRIGSEIIWSFVSSDAGAVRRPDIHAFKDAVSLRASLQAELSEQRRRHEAHEANLPLLARDVEAGRANVGQLITAVSRDSAHTRELFDLRDRLEQTERQLHALRYDPKTWLLIDDGSEEQAPVDLDAIEAETLAQRSGGGFAAPAAVRAWVTVAEFAHICSLSASQAREWARGRHLPFSPGDPRRPWEPAAVPVNRQLGPRRQRVIVSGVQPGFWDSEAKRLRLAEILSDWPATGHWPQEFEPAVAP